MKNTANMSFANPNNNFATGFNPFQKFDFTNFETFPTFASAKNQLSAGNFFDEARTFEFAFFSPFTKADFTEFTDFFVKEIAPKVKSGSFLKFDFFFSSFDNQFEFTKFNEFFSQFLKNGSIVEFSFFPIPSSDFKFDDFNQFEKFNSSFGFLDGNKFAFRKTIRQEETSDKS